MPRYQVTYRHARNGVRFVVEVDYAPSPETAEQAAASVLTAHLRATAGRVTEWAHAATVREKS